MAKAAQGAAGTIARQLPTGRLKSEVRNLAAAAGDRALASVRDQVGSAARRLSDYAEGEGGPGLMSAVTGAKQLAEGKSPARALLGGGMAGAKGALGNLMGRGGGDGQGRNLKVTNIVESIDVGVPVHVAYGQWTQFRDFPGFMKKVERVDQESDEELSWKAQVLWSHREWQATITKQVPDRMIAWRSQGQKGHVDGSVTFHELAPDLTRILLVLEYHPQGFFEHTGNLWRAQGRRARLELKHFRRHVMTQVIENPDEVEGWRGVIEDSKVVTDHDTAVQQEEAHEPPGPEEAEGEDAEGEDAEGEYDEGEYDEESEEDEAEEEEEAVHEPDHDVEPRRRRRR